MAEPVLAVLLRDGPHDGADTTRYALKCNDVAISISKTPIQIPIPQQSPELVDIGYFRPSITITGIVDTVGGNTDVTAAGFEGMSYFPYTRVARIAGDGGSNSFRVYYIPYKNALEEACAKWIFSSTTELEVEIGNAEFPIATHSGWFGTPTGSQRYSSNLSPDVMATGGAIYKVAIQQARFQVVSGKEDRYDFSLQLVSEARLDIPQ